jgi:glycosyltransferase involved in cell wall biosynthesis
LRGDSIERLAYRRASAVICNARHEVDFLRQKLGPPRAPVHVVYNGTELPPAAKTRSEWRSSLQIHADAPVVTMVANFRSVKDHETLLRAWRRMTTGMCEDGMRPQLLLAGAPQESYDAAYQLAGDLNLLTSVSFLGQIQDVSGLLQASDIGVLTSRHEGLPNAIIEYMASGLSVVATDVPGNREALGEDPQQPFCDPGDAEGIASRIVTLLTNPQLRRDVGTRNRLRAQTEFSVDAMCEKTVDILCELLSQRAVPLAR